MTTKQQAITELEKSDSFLLICTHNKIVRVLGSQSLTFHESLAFCQVVSKWLELHLSEMRKNIGADHRMYDNESGKVLE